MSLRNSWAEFSFLACRREEILWGGGRINRPLRFFEVEQAWASSLPRAWKDELAKFEWSQRHWFCRYYPLGKSIMGRGANKYILIKGLIHTAKELGTSSCSRSDRELFGYVADPPDAQGTLYELEYSGHTLNNNDHISCLHYSHLPFLNSSSSVGQFMHLTILASYSFLLSQPLVSSHIWRLRKCRFLK